MLNLVEKNKEMLLSGVYTLKDQRQMLQISTLKNINDYDLYLIACCLCNYKIPEIEEAIDLRQIYYEKTNFGKIDGYEHPVTDYGKVVTSIRCTNTGNINKKYGSYEFEINCTDDRLISDLWAFKNKDCLKYVDSKTYPDKIIVSIGKEQLSNFKKALDYLMIGYDSDDLEKNLFYQNKSENTLVDLSTLSLPFTPYDFQLQDAEAIVKKKRVLLGHDMGCGKSFISVLVGESIKMPKLVICPESLRLNWYKEIKQVVPNADVQVQLSNEEPHFGKDWTIVGYLTVSKYLYEFMQFKCIFVDEAHNCKAVNNWGKPTSKRALSVITLAENAEYCYLLSGTPLPSHNKDLFNIMKMLKCEEFDFNNQWAFKHFADKFCDPKETRFGKDYSGNSNSDVLHNYLSNLMVRRRKKEVLPNLKKQRQFIPVHPKFKKEYKDVEARIRKPQKGDTYMGLAMTGRMLLSQYKIETAIDLAESLLNAGESVVLVTNFIETADILKQHFKDNCVSIVGGMSDEKKQKAIDKFQKKEATVCVLNIAAGGVGITLTASHTMIIIDYAWMPTDMIQVEDRICRSGQTEPCMIYYIYCDNAILDNLFIEMISNKSENIDTVVDNVENTFDLTSEKESSSTFITKLILHLGLGVT